MVTTISAATAFLSVFLTCTCFVKGEGQNGSLSLTAVLEEKLKNYDKRMSPSFGTGSPVQITVSMYIMDISSVSEETMDFTLTCYFRQEWTDPRLARIDLPGWNREVVQDSEIFARIWSPDTFFVKDKETILHETTHPNSFLKIFPDGRIFRSIRITSKISCSMNLKYFPMDTQSCRLIAESYGYKASDVRYKWKSNVGIHNDLELMRYKLVGYRTHPEAVILLSSGNYSNIQLEFFFERDMGYYFINLYLPSILLVLLSCLSYWLGAHCTYSRGALTITCVLALAVLIAGNDDALPPVSYVRAIDVYIITCFFLVLLALVQFVVVHHMRPRSSQHYHDTEKAANTNEEQPLSAFQLDASLLKIMESHATKADKYAKFIVPAVFCLFNFLYWVIYLNVGGIEGEYTQYPNVK